MPLQTTCSQCLLGNPNRCRENSDFGCKICLILRLETEASEIHKSVLEPIRFEEKFAFSAMNDTVAEFAFYEFPFPDGWGYGLYISQGEERKAEEDPRYNENNIFLVET